MADPTPTSPKGNPTAPTKPDAPMSHEELNALLDDLESVLAPLDRFIADRQGFQNPQMQQAAQAEQQSTMAGGRPMGGDILDGYDLSALDQIRVPDPMMMPTSAPPRPQRRAPAPQPTMPAQPFDRSLYGVPTMGTPADVGPMPVIEVPPPDPYTLPRGRTAEEGEALLDLGAPNYSALRAVQGQTRAEIAARQARGREFLASVAAARQARMNNVSGGVSPGMEQDEYLP